MSEKRKKYRDYYVVTKGKKPGIYKNNQQAMEQIKGFSHGRMKKIKGFERAKQYFADHKKKRQESTDIYYVVAVGKQPGLYRDHSQAQKQIKGFPHAQMKKIKGYENAKRYLAENKEKNPHDTYYVVRLGKRPGLYKDLTHALEQVQGFPHGQMKKIKGYENAIAYMNADLSDSKNLVDKNVTPIVYIDGSYVQDIALSGYGYLVVHDELIIQRDFGIITDSDMIHLQSLGAEITALIRAMEWAIANNYKSINIVYDATGIISLIENDLDGKTMHAKGKAKFIDIYEKYRQYLSVHFTHRNDNALFQYYHQEAHHLSRLPYGMLSEKLVD